MIARLIASITVNSPAAHVNAPLIREDGRECEYFPIPGHGLAVGVATTGVATAGAESVVIRTEGMLLSGYRISALREQ
jgi:hypothetical protein